MLQYATVHDAGTVVNPKTLSGQIIGGTIQDLGTALYEEYLYDDEGRVRNETFEYYHLPSSMDVPTMTIAHQETPSRRPRRTDADAGGVERGGRGRARAIRRGVTSLPISAEQIGGVGGFGVSH